MFTQIWKTLRSALWVAGVLLSFFALVEVVRAYEVLRDLHPALGVLFLLLLLAGIGWLAVRYFTEVVRRPSILTAPARVDAQEATLAERKAYGRYLARVMRRLSLNENLSGDQRMALKAGRDELGNLQKAKADKDALVRAAKRAENEIILPAMDVLDQLAEKELRRCVRDVMLGVTLSPWRSADLLVVMYRNIGMVLQIVSIYNARPRFREQMLVFRDVFTIVATVNYLNYGSKLSENLLASVPGLGRFTDDVAQGVGAGLMTSIAGHSAIERCRDFRGWDRAEAQRSIIGTLNQFMADIKGIMVDQVVPHLRLEFLDRIKEGIATAIDETAKATDFILRKPVLAAGRGVAYTGTALTKTLLNGSEFAWRGISSGGGKAARFIGQASLAGGRHVLRGFEAGTKIAGKGVGASRKAIRAGVGKISSKTHRSREADDEEGGAS